MQPRTVGLHEGRQQRAGFELAVYQLVDITCMTICLQSNGQDSSKQHTATARRKSEDELPEGIRALKSRFSGAASNDSTSSPKVNVLLD